MLLDGKVADDESQLLHDSNEAVKTWPTCNFQKVAWQISAFTADTPADYVGCLELRTSSHGILDSFTLIRDVSFHQEWFTPGNLDLCPSRRSFSQGTMFNVDTDPV